MCEKTRNVCTCTNILQIIVSAHKRIIENELKNFGKGVGWSVKLVSSGYLDSAQKACLCYGQQQEKVD